MIYFAALLTKNRNFFISGEALSPHLRSLSSSIPHKNLMFLII